MQWTDHLDPIFVSNYEMDPVLSWQYFGSTKGTLRRFPSKCKLPIGILDWKFRYVIVMAY